MMNFVKFSTIVLFFAATCSSPAFAQFQLNTKVIDEVIQNKFKIICGHILTNKMAHIKQVESLGISQKILIKKLGSEICTGDSKLFDKKLRAKAAFTVLVWLDAELLSTSKAKNILHINKNSLKINALKIKEDAALLRVMAMLDPDSNFMKTLSSKNKEAYSQFIQIQENLDLSWNDIQKAFDNEKKGEKDLYKVELIFANRHLFESEDSLSKLSSLLSGFKKELVIEEEITLDDYYEKEFKPSDSIAGDSLFKNVLMHELFREKLFSEGADKSKNQIVLSAENIEKLIKGKININPERAIKYLALSIIEKDYLEQCSKSKKCYGIQKGDFTALLNLNEFKKNHFDPIYQSIVNIEKQRAFAIKTIKLILKSNSSRRKKLKTDLTAIYKQYCSDDKNCSATYMQQVNELFYNEKKLQKSRQEENKRKFISYLSTKDYSFIKDLITKSCSSQKNKNKFKSLCKKNVLEKLEGLKEEEKEAKSLKLALLKMFQLNNDRSFTLVDRQFQRYCSAIQNCEAPTELKGIASSTKIITDEVYLAMFKQLFPNADKILHKDGLEEFARDVVSLCSKSEDCKSTMYLTELNENLTNLKIALQTDKDHRDIFITSNKRITKFINDSTLKKCEHSICKFDTEIKDYLATVEKHSQLKTELIKKLFPIILNDSYISKIINKKISCDNQCEKQIKDTIGKIYSAQISMLHKKLDATFQNPTEKLQHFLSEILPDINEHILRNIITQCQTQPEICDPQIWPTSLLSIKTLTTEQLQELIKMQLPKFSLTMDEETVDSLQLSINKFCTEHQTCEFPNQRLASLGIFPTKEITIVQMQGLLKFLFPDIDSILQNNDSCLFMGMKVKNDSISQKNDFCSLMGMKVKHATIKPLILAHKLKLEKMSRDTILYPKTATKLDSRIQIEIESYQKKFRTNIDNDITFRISKNHELLATKLETIIDYVKGEENLNTIKTQLCGKEKPLCSSLVAVIIQNLIITKIETKNTNDNYHISLKAKEDLLDTLKEEFRNTSQRFESLREKVVDQEKVAKACLNNGTQANYCRILFNSLLELGNTDVVFQNIHDEYSNHFYCIKYGIETNLCTVLIKEIKKLMPSGSNINVDLIKGYCTKPNKNTKNNQGTYNITDCKLGVQKLVGLTRTDKITQDDIDILAWKMVTNYLEWKPEILNLQRALKKTETVLDAVNTNNTPNKVLDAGYKKNVALAFNNYIKNAQPFTTYCKNHPETCSATQPGTVLFCEDNWRCNQSLGKYALGQVFAMLDDIPNHVTYEEPEGTNKKGKINFDKTGFAKDNIPRIQKITTWQNYSLYLGAGKSIVKISPSEFECFAPDECGGTTQSFYHGKIGFRREFKGSGNEYFKKMEAGTLQSPMYISIYAGGTLFEHNAKTTYFNDYLSDKMLLGVEFGVNALRMLDISIGYQRYFKAGYPIPAKGHLSVSLSISLWDYLSEL